MFRKGMLKSMQWKFFPHDVYKGKMDAVGDKFATRVMGKECWFRVEEAFSWGCMAVLVCDDEAKNKAG
jgi:hypothetical protein